MTGFLTYHNHGSLCRRNTKTPTGLCYRTMETLNLLMATSTEGTSLSLPANQLESLLSWIGHKRGGIQNTGSIVKHSTLAGTRTNGDEIGSTNFYAHECENFRCSQSTQWQWVRCEPLLLWNECCTLVGEVNVLRRDDCRTDRKIFSVYLGLLSCYSTNCKVMEENTYIDSCRSSMARVPVLKYLRTNSKNTDSR